MKFFRSEKGFTLIDMAIAMMVIGLLTVPLLKEYDRYKKDEQRGKTEAAMQSVFAAVQLFAKTYERLPCPADPTLTMGDPNYGKELFVAGSPDQCLLGGTPTYTGSVPFQTLRISENLTVDMYDNKLTYAVSSNLIDGATPFENMVGNLTLNRRTITIASGGGQTQVIAPTASPQLFFVISHGEQGEGAYPRNSGVQIPCNGNAAGNTLEMENCDGDNVFLDEFVNIVDNRTPPGPSSTGLRSLNEDANYYDDFILTEEQFARDLFMDSNTNTNTVYSDNPRIGIGTNDPQAEVHVSGDVLVGGGQMQSWHICQENGSDCFQPLNLVNSGMICWSGAVFDFRNKTARCRTTDTGANLSNKTCPSGQYLNGFDGAGNPVCVTG